jgi:hypothetical protein
MPDCVTRAITTATGIPYYDILEMLNKNGRVLKCDVLNVRCYEKLLDFDFKLPHYIGSGKSAEQIANEHSDKVLLLRMEGHLSCSIYGQILDIFDCSKEEITDYWIVQ